MLVNTEALPFIPTLIWSNQIDQGTTARINVGVGQKLDELIAASYDTSHSRMGQTDHDLYTVPEVVELFRCFLEATNGIADFL